MKPKRLFQQMRHHWFFTVLYSSAHEREWETEEEEERRMANNQRMKTKFDTDTEAILKGDDRCLDPRCANDLGVKR